MRGGVEFENIKAIVTDIEGTTSSISFVVNVLFPFASKHLAGFVREHQADSAVAQLLDEVRNETKQLAASVDDVIAILLQWIDADKKATALKSLQGMIWKQGYESGELKGHIYQDAIASLRQWHEKSLPLYIYSSGSVAAQKLLFGYSVAGDLNGMFSGNFDTNIGGKKEPLSYEAIAAELSLPPAEILFLSDVLEELNAADEAGFQVVGLARDGIIEETGSYLWVSSFDQITI